MWQQDGKIATVVTRQQRARIARHKSRQQIDQRRDLFFREGDSPAIAQQRKVRQAHHHHDAMRAYFFLIFQQRGQLVIKEQAVA